LGKELDIVGQQEVDGLNVFANAVEHSPEGCGVEEEHGRSEDGTQQWGMQILGGRNAAEQQGRHAEEHEEHCVGREGKIG
jgi:hypothetical protein